MKRSSRATAALEAGCQLQQERKKKVVSNFVPNSNAGSAIPNLKRPSLPSELPLKGNLSRSYCPKRMRVGNVVPIAEGSMASTMSPSSNSNTGLVSMFGDLGEKRGAAATNDQITASSGIERIRAAQLETKVVEKSALGVNHSNAKAFTAGTQVADELELMAESASNASWCVSGAELNPETRLENIEREHNVEMERVEAKCEEQRKKALQGRPKCFIEAFEKHYAQREAESLKTLSAVSSNHDAKLQREQDKERVARAVFEHKQTKLKASLEMMKQKLATCAEENAENEKEIALLDGTQTCTNRNQRYRILRTLQLTATRLRAAKDAKIAIELNNRTRASTCGICMKSARNVVLQPCNHLGMCHECLPKLTARVCPFCRTPFKSSIHVKIA